MQHASRSERAITWLLCLLACAMFASPAATQGNRRERAIAEVSLRPPPGMRSHSLRFPWDGALMRGSRLKLSDYVRYVSEYEKTGRFYGTWELVQLIERGARRVAFRLPGAKLSVGELSGERGGDVGGHHSHESGRDADIGFFMTTADGKSYAAASFAEFDAAGRGLAPNGGLRFDDARNWELISKLVSDADARVQYIFVARTLRQRLLAEAARRHAAPDVVARAAAVLVEPSHGNPHRSHFHVRIYCAPADRPLCRDVAPFWPWYPGVPPNGMYAGISTRNTRTAMPSPLGSPIPGVAHLDVE